MQTKDPLSKSIQFTPLIVTLIYAFTSVVWIILTDYILAQYSQNIIELTWFQTLKGWVFIVLTSFLIFYLLRNRFEKLNKVTNELNNQKNDYQLMLHQASDAILISDEYGRFIEANNQAFQLTGYTLDEIKGLTIKDLISKDDQLKVPIKFHELYQGRTIILERKILTKSGKEVEVEISTKQLGNRKIQSIIRDISTRKKIEKEIIESERKYRLLFMDNPNPMWIFDMDTLEFLQVNNAAIEVYGYSYDEFLKMKLTDIRPKDEWLRLMQRVQEAVDPYIKSGPWKHKKKNGELMLVEISSSVVSYENKNARIALINDITDIINAENQLKENEQRFKLIFEKSPVSIWEENFSLLKNHIDLLKQIGITDFREYLEKHPEEVEKSVNLIKVNDINEATLNLYGAKSKDEIFNNFGMVVGDAALDVIKETMIAISENKAIEEIETENYKLNGEKIRIRIKWYVPESSREKYNRVLLTIVDITQLKETEETLKIINENLNAIVNASALPIFVIDHEYNVIQIWNNAAENFFGWKRNEVLGKNFPSLLDDTLQKFINYTNFVLSGNTITGKQIALKKKSGEECFVSISSAPLKNNKDQIIGAMMITADITETIRAANEIQKLNDEIELRISSRTNELESKNNELEEFSYSVSHDLKAPLRAIEGFSQIIYEKYSVEFNNEALKLFQAIRRNSLYMWDMIDDLLSLSRLNKTQLNMQKINMKEVIQIAINDLFHYEKRKIEINIKDLPDVKADKSMILQVWINLISNAIKFTQKSENPVIEIGGFKKEAENIYYVRDNGVGFDEQHKDKLFNPFQRLHSDKEFKGMGIGLTIVKRIVSRHGGNVFAESDQQKGTKFSFSLPAE